MKVSKAIILAAGAGKRLLPFTEDQPKCMARIGDISILENALQQFAEHDVTVVTLVVGHLQNKVREIIGTSYKGMKIEYIENADFSATNSMYSLYLSLKGVGDPVWVLEGDVFFDGKVLELAVTADFAWFADSSIRDIDGAYLCRDENGNVNSLEIIRDVSLLRSCHHKSMGLLKMSASGANRLYEWLDRGVSMEKTDHYYDLIVAEHLKEFPIHLVNVAGLRWFEIDTHEDLETARKIFAQ